MTDEGTLKEVKREASGLGVHEFEKWISSSLGIGIFDFNIRPGSIYWRSIKDATYSMKTTLKYCDGLITIVYLS